MRRTMNPGRDFAWKVLKFCWKKPARRKSNLHRSFYPARREADYGRNSQIPKPFTHNNFHEEFLKRDRHQDVRRSATNATSLIIVKSAVVGVTAAAHSAFFATH